MFLAELHSSKFGGGGCYIKLILGKNGLLSHRNLVVNIALVHMSRIQKYILLHMTTNMSIV